VGLETVVCHGANRHAQVAVQLTNPGDRPERPDVTSASESAYPGRLPRSSSAKRGGTLAAHLGPGAIWYIVAFIIPLGVLVRTSFAVVDNYQLHYIWTTSSYTQLFTDGLARELLGRTLLLALTVTVACLVLAFPAAWVLAKLPRRTRTLLLVLMIVPWWSSYIVRVFGWQMAFGENGMLNSVWSSLGLGHELSLFDFGWFAIALAEVNLYLPLMIIPVYLSLERLDPDVVLAALSLGASRTRTFRKVILPLTSPGIVTGFIFVFMPVTGEFVVPNLIGAPSNVLYGNDIINQFGVGYNWPYGSALALLLLVVLGCILALVLFAARRSTRNMARG
jgi:spermidine/putrescine transport system permease protein